MARIRSLRSLKDPTKVWRGSVWRNVCLATALLLISVAAPIAIATRYSTDPVAQAESAAACAGAGGVLAAAFVEITKRLTALRGIYQRDEVIRYFDDELERAKRDELSRSPYVDEDETAMARRNRERELLLNASGVVAETPVWKPVLNYAAPVAQLAGQLSDLGERNLVPPNVEIGILVALAGHDALPQALALQRLSTPTLPGAAENALQLRGRMDARIDAFQTAVGGQWKRGLRFLACGVAAAAAGLIAAGIRLAPAGIYTAVVAGFILGGVTAWTLGDFLATLERLGR